MDVRRTATEWLESLADRLGITLWSIVVGTGAIAAAAAGAWWAFAAPAPPPAEEVLPRIANGVTPAVVEAESLPGSTILVHVDGAVMRPGVHEMTAESRVVDAIAAAGGLRADADRARLNLAAILSDGQRVWVPVPGEDEPGVVAPSGGVGPESDEVDSGSPVNLNTADRVTLETLPGIGPSIAAAIIRHRDTEGAFERVEDLLKVAGIGPSRLAQLESLVTV